MRALPLHHPADGPPPHEAKLRREDRCFSDAAVRLAGLAGALLGWRAEEFWRSTPVELAVVLGAMMPDAEVGVSGDDLARLIGMFPDDAPFPSPRT